MTFKLRHDIKFTDGDFRTGEVFIPVEDVGVVQEALSKFQSHYADQMRKNYVYGRFHGNEKLRWVARKDLK